MIRISIFIIMTILSFNVHLNAQKVSNVSHQIIGDKIIVTYDLDKEADVILYVQANENKGLNTSIMN